MRAMGARERVMLTLRGEQVDRPPVSVWHHFFPQEGSLDSLVKTMVAFQRRFDWDFLKVNPRAHYHVEDWGVRYHYQGDLHVPPVRTASAVESPEDWAKITPLDPTQGVLGEHLEAVRRIRREMGPDLPLLMTVFTPVSIASRLTPTDEVFLQHLREHPERVPPALEAVTETFVGFARLCLDAGADGLFFATTSWATRDRWSEEEYLRYARPHDLKVLEAVQGAPFNVLHVCRGNNMLRLLADYPVQAFNWDTLDPTNPSLREASDLVGGALIGGVDHRRLHRATPEEVEAQVRRAVEEAGGRRVMVGPGCTVSPMVSETALEAVRRSVEKVARI